jgi:1-acyl-sn-glycerol-3-phosphate acyltransferase
MLNRLHNLVITVLTLLWMVVCFALCFPPLVLAIRLRWRMAWAMRYAYLLAWGVLGLAGVRVRVEGAEHFQTRPAVFLFNHTNWLDFFVNSLIVPPRTFVFGKRALVWIPLVGWVWLLSGHPLIRRGDRSQWQGLFQRVEDHLATGDYSTCIAPEGTRSLDGRLGPFKKGAFQMARKVGVPLVPMVLTGVEACYIDGRFRPGTIRVRVLPPIPTEGWTEDQLEERIEDVRGLYLEALGQTEARPAGVT